MAYALIDDEDSQATTASGRSLGTISTLVSLFLLLLVFFILLFSIAEVHRDRTSEVLTSVDHAFGGLPSRFGLLHPPAMPPATQSIESFVRAVTLLITDFAAITPAAAANGTDDVLRIELPPALLFRPGGAQLTEHAAAIVPRLAVLLQAQPPSKGHYRLTLRSTSSQRKSENQALDYERVANLASALFAAGCPADALEVGVQIGGADQVRMVFAVVAPDEAVQ